jgi:hypothetical protein
MVRAVKRFGPNHIYNMALSANTSKALRSAGVNIRFLWSDGVPHAAYRPFRLPSTLLLVSFITGSLWSISLNSKATY